MAQPTGAFAVDGVADGCAAAAAGGERGSASGQRTG
jgi:hypothetical protein